MTMFFTSSILMGFVRLCVIILFLFYLNRKFVTIKRPVSFPDFIVNSWFRYGSLSLILVFVLVQVNAYNLFNYIFLISFIIMVDVIGIRNLMNPREYFNTKIRLSLLRFLRDVELRKPLREWMIVPRKKKAIKNKFMLLLFLTGCIGALTFISRYYFIKYDNYSLSDAWIADLNRVIGFDLQYWFYDELSVHGELALVNLYGKITDVSPEIALQVISVLEATLLAAIIFWMIHKLTTSKFLAPLIGAFSFALVYVLTPLNVYYLLENNPTFMALTFAFPIMVFYFRPEILRCTKRIYFLSCVLAFIAIGLIDIFTFCILMPPFLIIAFIFTRAKAKLYNLAAFCAYFVSAALLFLCYSVASNYLQSDFWEFFHTNMLSVTSYTYVPQLIFPYDDLMLYFQYSTVAGTALVVLLVAITRENWRATLAFFVYINFLIFLTKIPNKWLDADMVRNSLAVFLPLIFGLNSAIVIRIFNFIFKRWGRLVPITATLLIVGIVFSSIYYQQHNINSLTESDPTPKQMLDAYDKISQTYFPYSYSIVNDPVTQVISTNKHFFMNYSYFLEDYPRIDSVYFKNRKDPKFLLKNPDYAVTKSVLVFVLNENNKKENNSLSENKYLASLLNKEIAMLQKRGRQVKLFYNSDVLRVYEIINEPGQSKTSDLIF